MSEAAVKEAAKALATAKGVSAVTSILASVGLKSFKDMRPEHHEKLHAALTVAL